METIQLLRDPDLPPTNELLLNELGTSVFEVYKALLKMVMETDFKCTIEWRYYNDGKSWLCKVTHKKKTVFWLSAWENHLKAGFYFTEKNNAGIYDLNIDPSIKEDFSTAKPIGKFMPLTLCIDKLSDLNNLKVIAAYKMSQK